MKVEFTTHPMTPSHRMSLLSLGREVCKDLDDFKNTFSFSSMKIVKK